MTATGSTPDGYARFYGNVAGYGVAVRTGAIPAGMRSFRGAVRICGSVSEAVAALDGGEIESASAIAVFPEAHERAGAFEALWRAIYRAGLDGRTCVLTDGQQDAPDGAAAVFSYGSAAERRRSGVELLRNGDILEYDAAKLAFNADIPAEGILARLAGAAADAPVVTRLYENTWAITERYSRMFLLKGDSSSLLIDTGFGGVDIGAVCAGLGAGPVSAVLTHGHWDHSGGISRLAGVGVGKADMGLLPERRTDADGREYSGECLLTPVADGEVFELGGRAVRAIACPGHTGGGTAFLDAGGRAVFAGDSVAEGPSYLFAEGSSPEALLHSLDRLAGMSADYDMIYSAHRRLELDGGYIADMRACIEGALDGRIEGETACIRRTDGGQRKYSFGKASVFMR